jgi:hypothetical protein
MRITRLWVLTLGVGFVIALSAPAAHAGCPLLGCLTEAVEDVTEVVEDTAHGGVELVDDTVESVPELVDDTEKEVEEAPELVSDTVDDVTNSEGPPVPVSETDPGDDPVRREQRSGPSEGRAAPAGRESLSPVSVTPLREPVVGPVRPSTIRSSAPGLLERIGEAAAVAARQLSFPLALSLIVVAFVLFQNYLDRKDPKLAVAPIAADVMKFE